MPIGICMAAILDVYVNLHALTFYCTIELVNNLCSHHSGYSHDMSVQFSIAGYQT